jgi:hypothetical protein
MLCHFFSCHGVDIQTKHNIYIAFPLRKILSIKWDQVQEDRIRNKQIRFKFCNIPSIEAFIIHRTARYVGKITRTSEDNFPKMFLGAWIKKPKKIGGVQHSCNKNFAKSISAIITGGEKEQVYKQGLFKDWILGAKNETTWLERIDDFFISCKKNR